MLTRSDPQLFATIYLSKHLRGPETGGRVSFSRFHLAMFDEAKKWATPVSAPAEQRTAIVAPRGAGKTTQAFLELPMWAGAHGHVDFIAAFADSAGQAELHLQTFKRELDTNELLRHDFPELCRPALRNGRFPVADNRSMYLAESGFVFVAKGIDSSSLGMKVGERRPRLLLFDDLEPDEGTYSLAQKEKRLITLREAALPLNVFARVLLVGTTTMAGSIMHDVARQVTEPDFCPEWVAEENIRTQYFPAIVTEDDGSEASLWPEKWPLEFLQSIRRTRSYQKNYDNRPVSLDGDFWGDEDFRYDPPEAVTRRILSIDPAAKSKATSDPTGLAIVGYDPTVQRCVVEHAEAVRLPPAKLREKVLSLLGRHDLRHVLIEDNNGGEWLAEVLSPLPAKVHPVTQHEHKNVRASKVLDYYQSGWVAHAKRLPALEGEMCAFPKGAHDDLVDAAGSAIHMFLKDRKRGPARRPTTRSYA